MSNAATLEDRLSLTAHPALTPERRKIVVARIQRDFAGRAVI
jgi:hypothetical protein